MEFDVVNLSQLGAETCVDAAPRYNDCTFRAGSAGTFGITPTRGSPTTRELSANKRMNLSPTRTRCRCRFMLSLGKPAVAQEIHARRNPLPLPARRISPYPDGRPSSPIPSFLIPYAAPLKVSTLGKINAPSSPIFKVVLGVTPKDLPLAVKSRVKYHRILGVNRSPIAFPPAYRFPTPRIEGGTLCSTDFSADRDGDSVGKVLFFGGILGSMVSLLHGFPPLDKNTPSFSTKVGRFDGS